MFKIREIKCSPVHEDPEIAFLLLITNYDKKKFTFLFAEKSIYIGIDFKENFDDKDFHSTNPRDINEDYIDKVDTDLFVDINDKNINKDNYKKKNFGRIPVDDDEDKLEVREGTQDFDDNIPLFLKEKEDTKPNLDRKGRNKADDETPFEDRFGRVLAPVNLETDPEETPLEYGVREEFKSGRNLRNKLAEIKRETLKEKDLLDALEEDVVKEEEKKFKDYRAR